MDLPQIDGCLLPPGTSVLPGNLRFAYIVDGGNGTPLVRKGNNKFLYKDDPVAPKNTEGSGWRHRYLHRGINPESCLYEQAIGK
mmetsp:Transcript_18097/g.37152  ORF Transcript_18097/g.37152 Transcript_18097/m.37152 type:complete len:84 (-) Transcript_18097:554-805(-)